MKKFACKIILTSYLVAFLTIISNAQDTSFPAFPGAMGGGAQSVGGRGGVVYEVTNLNDSGPGSFREGILMNVPRTIVFRVGGTINVTNYLEIKNSNLTIAGQTAPGGGIQIISPNCKSNILSISASNVIIRYMRLRHGYNSIAIQSGDPISIGLGSNCIFDHCTLMWTTDQNTNAWGSTNFRPYPNNITWSWNIIAEPMSSHPTNFITGSNYPEVADLMTNLDAHHNLFANSSHRNPLIKNKTFRFVNNIVYNWKYRASHTAGGVNADFIGNLYKPGPLAKDKHEICVFPVPTGEGNAPNGTPTIYVLGNKGTYNTNPSNDNWPIVWEIKNGENGINVGQLATSFRRTTPLPDLPIPIIAESVDSLESLIFPTVGASQRLDCLGNWVSNRDAVDKRIINEYNTTQGIIPSSESDVGGFPIISDGTPCADSDHDGMPDEWEIAKGLNPNNSADRNFTSVSAGYLTNLEAYLSGNYGVTTGSGSNEQKIIQIFPNPVNNELIVELRDGIGSNQNIRIYNILGNQLISHKVISNIETINTSYLPNGICFLKIEMGNSIESKIFLVRH